MSKSLKFVTKVISLFLSVILIYEISPVNAIATDVINSENNNIQAEYDDNVSFYYGSHSLDAGRAGTVSVNDYTLTESVMVGVLSIDGYVSPVSISMRYNSAEYRFSDDLIDYTATAYGKGWLTNYNICIRELNYENTSYLAYLTGNGSVILFEQAETTDTHVKWTAVSEYYDIYIYEYSDSYELFNNTLIYSFDAHGRCVKILNTQGNTSIDIEYGSVFEEISKITDGVGNEYRFTYTDGKLSKIKCYTADGTEIIAGDDDFSAPLEISFTYENDRLTQVTFPDGKAATYEYSLLGKLNTVKNIDGYKVELSYTADAVSKIAEYALDENNEYTAGNYVNISSDGNTRTFTDNKGDTQIKTYDDYGNILTIVDGDGNYLYGEPEEEEEESFEIIPEEESSEIYEEETSEEYYESLCPCENCTEWECECECESEEVCTCIQCKRYSDTSEDAHGNILSESSFDGTKTMSSVTTYTSNGNYMASSVDTSGNTVYYIYGEDGFLDSMTSGASTVNFAYDSMGNLVELSQQNSIEDYVFTMSNQYTYTNDRVTSITHNGFSYNFTYDEWGNQTTVSVNENVLVSYEYDYANDDRLTKINYANGQSETYTYDTDGNITAISHDGGETATYAFTYDADGVLTTVTDNRCGLVTTYSDSGTQICTTDNELVYSSVYNEDGTQTENVLGNAITYTYNSEYNQVTGKTVSTKAFDTEYAYTDDDILYAYEQSVDTSVTTDWFGRTESKTIDIDTLKTTVETEETSEYSVIGEYNFTYADTDTTASTKITSHSSSFVSSEFTNNRTDYYEYDAQGNITGIYRYVDDVKTYYYTYEYDNAGQLIRENLLESSKTVLYSYDVGGNITSKTEYPYTLGEITADTAADTVTSYTYEQNGWNDKLTNFTYTEGTKQRINTALTYDASGNVTSFNGGTYTWTAGRQLETYSASDGKQYNYYYNADGFLSHIDAYNKSDVLTDSFDYIWDGDKLIARKYYSHSDDEGLISQVVYDSDDEAIGFITYGFEADTVTYEDIYLYRKNLQGDITGILTYTGKLIAEYSYDAYGNVFIDTSNVSMAIASIIMMLSNPLMYRGYVYTFLGDEISYYLGSRYYIPQLGRFLNADKHTDTDTGVLGTNMYAYCNNNPVMFVDPSGEILTLISKLVNAMKKLIQALTAPATKSINYNELFMFAAIVYAEAGGESDLCKRAVAHCIMNRVGTGIWKKQTTVTAVITAPYQFTSYNSPMYKEAMDYYNYNTYSSTIDKKAMDDTLTITKKVYTGKDQNISNGATYFYSPQYPGDKWYYADSYTQVYITGISSNIFMFYKQER